MMAIRLIEAKDLQEIAGWEREIAIISFGEEAITDIAFHLRKLEKAVQRERSGMQWAVNEGCRNIVGHVLVHNLPMRALYKKYGFAPTHLTMEYRVGRKEEEAQND